MTRPLAEIDRKVLTDLYPADAIATFCREAHLSLSQDFVVIGERACCIVGAMNVAAMLSRDLSPNLPASSPGYADARDEYELATGEELSSDDKDRLVRVMRRWDGDGDNQGTEPTWGKERIRERHRRTLAALCAKEETGNAADARPDQ